jgi:hypothetical protein
VPTAVPPVAPLDRSSSPAAESITPEAGSAFCGLRSPKTPHFSHVEVWGRKVG